MQQVRGHPSSNIPQLHKLDISREYPMMQKIPAAQPTNVSETAILAKAYERIKRKDPTLQIAEMLSIRESENEKHRKLVQENKLLQGKREQKLKLNSDMQKETVENAMNERRRMLRQIHAKHLRGNSNLLPEQEKTQPAAPTSDIRAQNKVRNRENSLKKQKNRKNPLYHSFDGAITSESPVNDLVNQTNNTPLGPVSNRKMNSNQVAAPLGYNIPTTVSKGTEGKTQQQKGKGQSVNPILTQQPPQSNSGQTVDSPVITKRAPIQHGTPSKSLAFPSQSLQSPFSQLSSAMPFTNENAPFQINDWRGQRYKTISDRSMENATPPLAMGNNNHAEASSQPILQNRNANRKPIQHNGTGEEDHTPSSYFSEMKNAGDVYEGNSQLQSVQTDTASQEATLRRTQKSTGNNFNGTNNPDLTGQGFMNHHPEQAYRKTPITFIHPNTEEQRQNQFFEPTPHHQGGLSQPVKPDNFMNHSPPSNAFYNPIIDRNPPQWASFDGGSFSEGYPNAKLSPHPLLSSLNYGSPIQGNANIITPVSSTLNYKHPLYPLQMPQRSPGDQPQRTSQQLPQLTDLVSARFANSYLQKHRRKMLYAMGINRFPDQIVNHSFELPRSSNENYELSSQDPFLAHYTPQAGFNKLNSGAPNTKASVKTVPEISQKFQTTKRDTNSESPQRPTPHSSRPELLKDIFPKGSKEISFIGFRTRPVRQIKDVDKPQLNDSEERNDLNLSPKEDPAILKNIQAWKKNINEKAPTRKVSLERPEKPEKPERPEKSEKLDKPMKNSHRKREKPQQDINRKRVYEIIEEDEGTSNSGSQTGLEAGNVLDEIDDRIVRFGVL